MSIDVLGGTFFIPTQLINLFSYALILLLGVLGILPDLRAGNRRRAVATGLFTAALLTAAVIPRWLPFTLKHWSFLLLMFSASVYFGVYFSAMWLVLGSLTAYLYASRGWLAF